jgi:hypothetical protein
MPFTKFSNLDFDQIKTSIKDYLRSNSNFTDFDFEGSNFSVLIDTLAYNTYITAFNSNMIVNESFLDSATVRENVVSLARNIGYVPYSRNSSTAAISFSVNLSPNEILDDNTKIYTSSLTLQAGLVCTGSTKGSSYVFSIPENITVPVVDGVASFNNIPIQEGTLLSKKFTVNNSLDQKFILDNSFVDISTIRVYVKGSSDSGLGSVYSLVDNIFNVDSNSEIFLIQEIPDEKYQLLFGDGIFGKKLENESIITVNYIITSGKDGNGIESFSFAGSFVDAENRITIPNNDTINVTTNKKSQNGSDIESIDSIRYYAPRLYASQYRAVTASDYESIIKSKIYKNAESISVIGGEELTPPQFGTVLISIKPKNGTFVSDFDKDQILSKLRQYSVSGINAKIVDLKILYVEIESYVYYNYNKVGNVSDLKTNINSAITKYSESLDLNKFGGRFKYSKILQVIDNTDTAITSNITRVRIRRDLKALLNRPAQYEICFGNRFHVNEKYNQLGYNIRSTGFTIEGSESDLVYFTDTPNPDGKTGIISVVKPQQTAAVGVATTVSSSPSIVILSAGVVDYISGEIKINTINITSTSLENDIVEIQAYPESNDVVGLKDLYVSFDVSKSQINMIKDTIASGEDISGVIFTKNSYQSSYSNENLTRS